MNNYLISLKDSAKNVAGPKANMDNIKFLSELGFKNYWLKFDTNTGLKSRVQKFILAHYTIPKFLKTHQGIDNIVLQYPLYSSYLMTITVKLIKQYTNANLYFIIHDVESIRLFINQPKYYTKEISFLNQANGIVVHNNKMKDWLAKHGVEAKLVDLQIFDYDNPCPILKPHHYGGTVCYAGNLHKSEFLTKLKIKHNVHIFGPNPANSYPQNVNYEGQYSPDDLPKHLKYDFGLVWDGTAVDTCNGVFGKYMRYNDPHKTSLYLSSGLPVIIWSEAALADFVKENKVGIVVSNLNDLDSILDNFSDNDYQELVRNTRVVAQRMRQGKYVKNAIKKLIKHGEE